jgi:hypothetical protein
MPRSASSVPTSRAAPRNSRPTPCGRCAVSPGQASSASSSVGTWPHTVFVVSWHNPGGEDRETGLADSRTLGVLAALDAMGRVVPDRPVHAAGYCLGGTLLTIAPAPGTYVLER